MSFYLKEHLGRLKYNPNTPGKLERDHAGHLIADVFGGSPELDNLVSPAKDVNLKQYREIEREWEKALKKVPPDEITDLKIEVIYDGNNVRPNAFNIKYKKNGRVIKVPTIYNQGVKMFEDEFSELQADMVDICNEYSKGLADKKYLFMPLMKV